MDETKNIEHLHSCAVPEQYRAYSCMELTDDQIEYARAHLNETEEARRKYLRRIKRFVDSKFHFYSLSLNVSNFASLVDSFTLNIYHIILNGNFLVI